MNKKFLKNPFFYNTLNFFTHFHDILRKSIVAIVSLVAIFGMIFYGILFYSYSQLNISSVDLSSVEIHLENLSLFDLVNLSLEVLSGNWESVILEVISEIDLGIVFELTNDGFFPVYVPDIYYDLFVSDILVGRGYSHVDTTINPGESKKIDVFQNLQKTSLNPTINSIIKDKGIMDIRINGTANFELFGKDISIPFETDKQISLIDEVLNKINQQKEN